MTSGASPGASGRGCTGATGDLLTARCRRRLSVSGLSSSAGWRRHHTGHHARHHAHAGMFHGVEHPVAAVGRNRRWRGCWVVAFASGASVTVIVIIVSSIAAAHSITVASRVTLLTTARVSLLITTGVSLLITSRISLLITSRISLLIAVGLGVTAVIVIVSWISLIVVKVLSDLWC